MLKLKKYLKPYIALCIACIILLFAQVITELNLPNYLSKIVDDGLQKGGITSSVPQAISSEGMQLLNTFMSTQEINTVDNAYVSAQALQEKDEAYAEKIFKKFPQAQAKNSLVLKSDITDEEKTQLESIFSHSMYAFMSMAQDMMSDSGTNSENITDTKGAASFDTKKIYAMLPMLTMVPEQTIKNAVSAANDASETVLAQTSAAFVKGFYSELGADTAKIQMQSIIVNGAIMLLFSLLDVLAAIGVGYCASRVGAGFAKDLRRDVFKKVSGFSNSKFDKFSTASLITRTTNDVTQMQMVVVMGLRLILFAPIMGIGAVIMALNKSASMSWILVLAVIVLIGIIAVIASVALPKFKIMQKLIDKLNLVTRENLSGMMVIRAFGNQKFEEERFDKANVDLTQNSLFVNRATMILFPCMTLIMNGTMLLIVWIGAQQIVTSSLQVGAMMAFMQYAMEVIMSFLMISMMFIMLPRASVSGERINEVLQTVETVNDPKVSKGLQAADGCEICFNDVSFCYDGADENVLENITFTAKPGQTTAFIGSTGSGKSTLVNLVPRFYDVTHGSITINGVDIRDITQAELRDQIGYVPQKGVLFSGDIASNLRYGDENASLQDLTVAAKTAQAIDFINEKPDGFETEISQGGTNVSGGQRQRLSIARALVKKANIYIFDDSFSALDFKTDAALRRALAAQTQKSTVLLVAQRISTIMKAEQIVVLSEGKIVGIGTHKQLLENCETYKEIALSQLSKEELA